MALSELDTAADSLADAVESALRRRLAKEFAQASEAISGLVAANSALIGALWQSGAVELPQVREALERATQALPLKERQGKKGDVLRDMTRMVTGLEQISQEG